MLLENLNLIGRSINQKKKLNRNQSNIEKVVVRQKKLDFQKRQKKNKDKREKLHIKVNKIQNDNFFLLLLNVIHINFL